MSLPDGRTGVQLSGPPAVCDCRCRKVASHSAPAALPGTTRAFTRCDLAFERVRCVDRCGAAALSRDPDPSGMKKDISCLLLVFRLGLGTRGQCLA